MSYTYDYGTQQQSGYDAYASQGFDDPYSQANGYADDGAGGGAGGGYDDAITQEDCWTVIAAYFADKTLVSQQIDSFNEFVNNTMQELVDEGGALILDQNMQHTGKAGDVTKRYELNFGQIYLSKPTQTEADGTVAPMFPNEARLRNLTYSAPLYIDMKKRVLIQESDEPDPETGELRWVEEKDGDGNDNDNGDEEEKIYIGKVPIMLQSDFCILDKLEEKDKLELNECPFDKGGYFVINGSEKVLIAQERMATNRVYVFAKSQPSPITYLAEIRSAVEKGGKTISSMQVKMMRRLERQSGQTIKSTLPYIRADVPIVVVFRALDIIPDKDILDHICYDRNDPELFEMMKPCLEDAFPIQNRDVALDFIGRRGTVPALSRERRINYAQEILQKEMLPHVSMAPGQNTKKAFFFGYMVHRLLLAALERRELDDRDHFGAKRLDLAGPLLAALFRMLFRKLTKDVYRHLQK
ncbi:hypothetical protein JCM8547_004396, partial [Rhodosporidiobolus lusitaniae]